MDFFLRNLEQAQSQAKAAALNAQKSAQSLAQQVQEHGKVLAEQVTENTKLLAEQASTLSNAAAESASQRLRSIEGFQPKMGSLGKQAEPKKPSPAELTEFGITDEFLDFVRSLTYSTFRDFPADALPSPTKVEQESSQDQVKYLTPWQEHHAMLVVQVAKEINELRYVLCPKRMTDAQFWQIYFQLAKKYLPPEAFDPSFVPSKPSTQGMTWTDLQVRLSQLSTSAKQWSSQTQASLRSVAVGHFGTTGEAPSSALHEIAAARGAGVAAGAAAAGAAAAASSSRDASAEPETALDADQELEAYLRDVMQHEDAKEAGAAEGPSRGKQGRAADGAPAGDAGGQSESFVDAPESNEDDEDDNDDDDDDFEKYLNELSGSDDAELVDGHAGKDEEAGPSKDEYESGEDLDLDDYMRVLADEDK